MAKKLYEESNIAAIAAKIREKTGGSSSYKASEMPSAIDEVYDKGYENGKSEGGGLEPSEGLYFNETYDGDGYCMYINTYGWSGISDKCKDTEIVVPCANPANGRPVVSVGCLDDKFEVLDCVWLDNISKIYLPDTITRIEKGALEDGYSVKYIKFGRYVNYIGAYQFIGEWNMGWYPSDLVLDFSDFALSSPPVLEDTSLFNGVVQIRVPTTMVDKFKTATNWASAADKIVDAENTPFPDIDTDNGDTGGDSGNWEGLPTDFIEGSRSSWGTPAVVGDTLDNWSISNEYLTSYGIYGCAISGCKKLKITGAELAGGYSSGEVKPNIMFVNGYTSTGGGTCMFNSSYIEVTPDSFPSNNPPSRYEFIITVPENADGIYMSVRNTGVPTVEGIEA